MHRKQARRGDYNLLYLQPLPERGPPWPCAGRDGPRSLRTIHAPRDEGSTPVPRFLIEVQHEGTVEECARAAEIFIRTGSHFLTHADWGCMDGNHRAWIIVEVDTREEARGIVPPAFRSQATIVQLNAFTLAQVEELRRHHQA